MNIKKLTVNSLLLLAYLPLLVVWLVFIGFGIITPAFGNIYFQGLWFAIFFGLAIYKIVKKSNWKIITKVFTIVLLLIFSVPVQGLNLFGSLYQSNYKYETISNCGSQSIYMRKNSDFSGAISREYFSSVASWLYLKSEYQLSETGKISRSEFRSESDYFRFRDCVMKEEGKV